MRSKVKAFIKSAREIAQAGLVVASSGNLSWRVGEDEILISRRTSWLGELKEKDVVRYPLTGVGGQKERVSCEIALHQKVLQKRKDVMVVLHFQSPAATALACWKKRIENFFLSRRCLPILAQLAMFLTVPQVQRN
jgi:ribulose-5-phosphate 4-epimerase/fuculose-1-phosphate aldolase